MLPLILASTSKYRKQLLTQLGLEFSATSPLFDEETAKTQGTDPRHLAEHLAFEKAKSLCSHHNCVIGGDQLIHFEGKILGKPGTLEKAKAQLKNLSGKDHELITSISVIYAGKPLTFTNITKMKMRTLNKELIENYLDFEKPFDCAGSYKIEGRGITLFEKIETDDFTAIQGIPLIQLTTVLKNLGYNL